MSFTVDLEGDLQADWLETLDEIGEGLGPAVLAGAVEGSAEAVATHKYTDRTTNLTKSIGERMVSSDAFSAEAEMYAEEDYASFVENGTSRARAFPFMGQAATKAEAVVVREAEVAIDAAGKKLESK